MDSNPVRPAQGTPPPPSDDEVIAELIGSESKGADPRLQKIVDELMGSTSADEAPE